MANKFLDLAFTDSVKQAQTRYYGGSRRVGHVSERDPLTSEELGFIAARDSFYLATVSEDGWPYIQHRGGPPGFLKVVGPNRLGFADLSGNRQLLSTGNLAANDRVALFLMDYPRQERLKLLGHAQVLDAREHSTLADQLAPSPELRRNVERLFVIDVVAYDWNCPKYITPRYTVAEVETAIAPLRKRLAELEAQLAANNIRNPESGI